MNIQETSIAVPGGKVFIRQWMPDSPDSDVPVVMLHDSLGSVDQWRNFPAELAEALNCPVIAYDRLGFGKSDAQEQPPAPTFIIEEATVYFPAIKQALDFQQYILFGHSVGGGMAINIAARDKDCCAVITMAAQAFVEPLTRKGIEEAMEMFSKPGQMGRLEKWHGSKASWVLNAWAGSWLSPAFDDWSLEACIGQVSCPVLAMHGDNDEYGSKAFPEYIAGHVGGASAMVLLENCGHIPHKEMPEKVINITAGFLREYRVA